MEVVFCVLVQDPLLRETPAAAARGALVVAGEPGPEVRGVAAVAALRAHCRGAGTRQPTQRAADRGAARAALLAHRAVPHTLNCRHAFMCGGRDAQGCGGWCGGVRGCASGWCGDAGSG